MQISVDGKLVVDAFYFQAATEHAGTVDLTAGQRYPIRIRYFQGGGGTEAHFPLAAAGRGQGRGAGELPVPVPVGRRRPCRHSANLRGPLPGPRMIFSYFERRIRPTLVPAAPPPEGLLRFYWHFVRQTRGLYAAMFVTGLVVAMIDTSIPVFIGKLVALMQTDDRAGAFRSALPALVGMGLLVLIGRPLALLGRQPGAQQRRRAGRDQPHPLAEPLARGASELAVLPERLRRPHREPRDADRQRGARVRGVEHPRRLVHRDLRHQRAGADGDRRLAARRADRPLGRRLHGLPAVLRAAHARPREDLVGGALARDGPRRRQLHQHPDREAVRPRARTRTRTCAR